MIHSILGALVAIAEYVPSSTEDFWQHSGENIVSLFIENITIFQVPSQVKKWIVVKKREKKL